MKLLADLIYGIGWLVGTIKYKLGIFVKIPEKFQRK
jgi:hypothetical protein